MLKVPVLPVAADASVVEDFSFAPPSEPPPKYVPDYQAFNELEPPSMPGHGDNTGVSTDFGKDLLRTCLDGNWIQADQLLRFLENAWRSVEDQTGVRAAVNYQDATSGMSAVFACTTQNKPNLVERLAAMGADVNMRIKDQSTALHFAATSLKEEMVKLLITSGADATCQGGPLNQLPLQLGCMRRHGSFPIVQYLLCLSGEDARLMEDSVGQIALWRAAEASHVHVVKELLKEHSLEQLSYHNKTQNGDTIMHAVLRRDQTEFLQMFLEAGAPVDARNFDDMTLLHIAVLMFNKAAIELLVEYHAVAVIVDKYDRTPLQLAVEKGLDQIVDLLTEKYKGSIHIRTKDGSTLAHIAALSGHPETVLTLLKRGVYLHMPNKSGALALHAAARTGHAQVVKALLARGSKVDAKTRDNYTALHLAIEYGKPSVVEVLLGAGASVHTKGGKNGETPLLISARVPNGERSAQLLLKCGADPNARLENGESALMVAARGGALSMMRLLLQDKADPLATSVSGETAFAIAVRACHYDIAKELLDFIVAKWDRHDGISVVNMANVEGETPLHFVSEILPAMIHVEGEDGKLLQLCLDYEADPGVQTKLTMETPIHYLARHGSEAVLTALLKSIGSARTQSVINKQSKTGWSPLLVASEGGLLKIVKILLKNHARVDVFDDQGKNALHVACENGHLELADLLIRSRAFVNAKTKLGTTCLHLAAMKGWNDIVQLLVEKYEATVDSLSVAMQTPLHLAAAHDRLAICEMLLKMGANPLAVDEHGQNSLHIAAECDNEVIVQLFLKVLADKNPLTIADVNGNNTAHIAAKQGSDAVMQLLLRFNKTDTVTSTKKGSDSTVLHVAAAGGHAELVKELLAAGASPVVENADGMTAMHLAAKYGHLGVIEVLREVLSPKINSLKNGLNPLHLSCFYGQAEATRELLTVVPATVRSDEPTANTASGHELACEAGLTPLHLACKSGQEAIVRLLLNYPGVQVDVLTEKTGYIPLHQAALHGHIAVVGLLLSRSGAQLNVQDAKGMTPIMLAAIKGHKIMASLLIGQGADLNATDHNGWNCLHAAAVAGHLDMVILLCENGADTMALTRDKKIALCYAVHAAQSAGRGGHEGHVEVMKYLMRQKHNTWSLMDDPVFLMDLMQAAKNLSQKPILDFLRYSDSPMELALKLSKLFLNMSVRDKFHAKDLILAAKYCSQAGEILLSLSCSKYNANEILRAEDSEGLSLIDMLIIDSHKQAVALVPVQTFLTSIWYGGLVLSQWQITLTFIVFLLCPPLWLVLSIPFPHRVSRVPFLKLVVHVISHLYFIIIMILVFMTPFQPLYMRQDLSPKAEEWLFIFWLIGNFFAELTSHEERRGLGRLRTVVLLLGASAVIIHLSAIGTEDETKVVLLYIRCQLLATACFFADIQILSYLSFHQLFGPFAIMLSDIVTDLMRFLVFFSVFLVGFSFSLSALYEANVPTDEKFPGVIMDMVLDPFASGQLLYWSIFGLIDPFLQIPKPIVSPTFALSIIWILFGIYMTVTMIILVNLLIAMLSDTYQRIKARSDLEWKHIRAKIIMNMEKTPISPPPINIISLAVTYIIAGWKRCMDRNTFKRVGTSDEILLGSSGSKPVRSLGWHPGMAGSRTHSQHRMSMSLHAQDAPAKKLADVVPWKDVIVLYEEEVDRGFDD